MTLFNKLWGDRNALQVRSPPRTRNFLKRTHGAWIYFKNMHAVFFWESSVFLEGTWPVKRCGPIAIGWRGSLRWENAMGSCKVNTCLELGFYHSPIALGLRSDKNPTYMNKYIPANTHLWKRTLCTSQHFGKKSQFPAGLMCHLWERLLRITQHVVCVW